MNPWIEPLARLSFRDALDILLVAVIIYNLLLLLKGTRVVNLLLGLGALLALYTVANLVRLQTLRAFLNGLFFYLPLAVIIMFQQEIRRVLTSIVRNPFSKLIASAPEETIIQEMVLAATTLSSKHTGALLVVERNQGLRHFIESGVSLSAEISLDLLETIFHPRTPLHDGAVIIQGGRIAAAGCFLPLTQNPALTKEYGTRHRAAIGITEETDCLSLVVSEETGRISVAAFGELMQGLSLPDVAERINRHFGVHRPTPMHIDEFPADIPLAEPAGPARAEAPTAEPGSRGAPSGSVQR